MHAHCITCNLITRYCVCSPPNKTLACTWYGLGRQLLLVLWLFTRTALHVLVHYSYYTLREVWEILQHLQHYNMHAATSSIWCTAPICCTATHRGYSTTWSTSHLVCCIAGMRGKSIVARGLYNMQYSTSSMLYSMSVVYCILTAAQLGTEDTLQHVVHHIQYVVQQVLEVRAL